MWISDNQFTIIIGTTYLTLKYIIYSIVIRNLADSDYIFEPIAIRVLTDI